MKHLLILLFSLFLLSGCLSDIGDPGIGPCVHIFDDPILQLESATSTLDGKAIDTLLISKVTFDSLTVDLKFLIAEASHNIVATDSNLICTVPCGFGTEKGQYNFTVSSENYAEKSISAFAAYKNLKGGCPSSSSGSHKINISLNPQ